MDVPVWRLRGRGQGAESESPPATGRIRLEAGSGRWLLVVDDAERARHATLLEDIRAALGTSDCRFGTWSDSPESGVAVTDWAAHGIHHALVFGDGEGADGRLVDAGTLDALVVSGDARRALWLRLKSLLGD